MKEFATLREAIDSWYANKAIPSIVVLLMSGIKIAGLLRDYTDSEIIVEIAGTKERQSILIPDVEQVELIWDGSAISMESLTVRAWKGCRYPAPNGATKLPAMMAVRGYFKKFQKARVRPIRGHNTGRNNERLNIIFYSKTAKGGSFFFYINRITRFDLP